MAYHWVGWIIVEQNDLSLNLMCFKLPQNLDISRFRERHSLAGRTFLYVWFGMRQHESFIIIVWREACLLAWDFSWVFLKIWIESSLLEVDILLCTSLWAALHKIFPIWGYCAFPHEWNCGKIIIKHHMKLRWNMASCWIYNQSYQSCIKWWGTKISLCMWAGFPLGYSIYIDLQFCIQDINWTAPCVVIFNSYVCCCDWKFLHRSIPVTTQL